MSYEFVLRWDGHTISRVAIFVAAISSDPFQRAEKSFAAFNAPMLDAQSNDKVFFISYNDTRFQRVSRKEVFLNVRVGNKHMLL